MLTNMLSAFAVLLVLLVGWVALQSVARRVAREHPEAGPYREAGAGCGGGGCGSCADSCADARKQS